MSPIETAALLIGEIEQHIDHLAPLCAHLSIPLFVSNYEIFHLVKEYYPDVDTRPFDKKLLLREYKAFISCYTKHVLNSLFAFDTNFSQLTIWCPHGNSDKGHSIPLMESLKGEDVVLYYGEKMLNFIKERGAFSLSCTYIPIGNYRKKYFEERNSFYADIYKKKVQSKISNYLTTYLYAPTWDDSEKNSSLITTLPRLIDRLTKETGLIVKVHPNDLQLMSPQTMQLIYRAEDTNNILILEKFPPIYPLLTYIDGYIGDMSSIGYDFLAFNKPMFFDTNKKSLLCSCGDDLHAFPTPSKHSKEKQKLRLYEYTFSKPLESKGFWKKLHEARDRVVKSA